MATRVHHHQNVFAFNQEIGVLSAAEAGNAIKLAEMLGNGGINVDAPRSKDGSSALIEAVYANKIDCLRVLLDAGADTEIAIPTTGMTALLLAAKQGYVECVFALTQAGAKTEAVNKKGNTALMRATMNKHARCVRVLLKAGANKDAVCEGGLTPLAVARRDGDSEVIAAFEEHIAVLEASRLLQAQLDDQIAKQQLADEQTAQQLAVAAALATDRFERAIVSNTIDALREALVANVAQIESLPALADNAAVSALRRVAQTKLFALVETGINKAVRARDLAALKSLIALIEINIAWMEPSPSSSSDSTSSATSAAPQFLTNAKRAIPYLELRTAKPDHNTWTCDEFIMAFEVVARSKSLHVDSIDAAVQYFRDEVVDGSLLGALEEDVFLKEAVPAGVRRARLLLAFKELN